MQRNITVATLLFEVGWQHWGLPLCSHGSAGLALTGGASAAGMGAAGTGPTGMGTALGFTPLFSRVERLSIGLTLTGGASAA